MGNLIVVQTDPTRKCHTCKYGFWSNKDHRWYCGAGDSEVDTRICEKAFVDIHKEEFIG